MHISHIAHQLSNFSQLTAVQQAQGNEFAHDKHLQRERRKEWKISLSIQRLSINASIILSAGGQSKRHCCSIFGSGSLVGVFATGRLPPVTGRLRGRLF
jgi:hypothetical protein